MPDRYAGIWSHAKLDSKMQALVPFRDRAEFVQFMLSKPFILIANGKPDHREQVAAAILKRTFSFSPTRYGGSRARFADAYGDMLLTRGYDGASIVTELEDYKTLVLLELQNIESKDAATLRRILWSRKNNRRYTILTIPSSNDLIKLHDSIVNLVTENSRFVSL